LANRSRVRFARTRVPLVAAWLGVLLTLVPVVSAQAAAASKPKSGGTVTYLYPFNPLTLDPLVGGALGSAGEAPYHFAIFDALSYIDTSNGKIVYETAESLTSSNGNLIWTLKLRPNIKFTDGTPYDASAVQYNWERIANPANASPDLSIAGQIASMKVVDSTTLQITLSAANSQFPTDVAVYLPYIGSPTAEQKEGSNFGQNPVGAGPFTLQTWLHGSELEYVRNPHYWDAPRPYISNLNIEIAPAGQQEIDTFNANEAQIAFMNLNSNLAKAAISVGTKASVDIASGGLVYILNNNAPPFNNLAARQAFDMAINDAQLDETVFSGDNIVPTSYFSPNSPYYDKKIQMPKYNPTKAQQLFNEAAQQLGGPVTFTLQVGAPTNTPAAEYVQAELAQYKNVSMTIHPLLSSQITPLLATGNYQASTTQLGPMFSPDPALYNFVQSASAANFDHINSPTIDKALATARASTNPAVWVQQYDIVQTVLYQQIPFIVYNRPALYDLMQSNVHGFINTNQMLLANKIWLS
jgi:peptide/nickel transport system substrate-binding protein